MVNSATPSTNGFTSRSNGANDSEYNTTFAWTDDDWSVAGIFSCGSVNHWHYPGNGATSTSSSTGNFVAGNGTYNTTEHGDSLEITAHPEMAD